MVWKSIEIDKMIQSMAFHDNKTQNQCDYEDYYGKSWRNAAKMEQQNRANRALDRVKEKSHIRQSKKFQEIRAFSHLKDDRSDALKNLCL